MNVNSQITYLTQQRKNEVRLLKLANYGRKVEEIATRLNNIKIIDQQLSTLKNAINPKITETHSNKHIKSEKSIKQLHSPKPRNNAKISGSNFMNPEDVKLHLPRKENAHVSPSIQEIHPKISESSIYSTKHRSQKNNTNNNTIENKNNKLLKQLKFLETRLASGNLSQKDARVFSLKIEHINSQLHAQKKNEINSNISESTNHSNRVEIKDEKDVVHYPQNEEINSNIFESSAYSNRIEIKEEKSKARIINNMGTKPNDSIDEIFEILEYKEILEMRMDNIAFKMQENQDENFFNEISAISLALSELDDRLRELFKNEVIEEIQVFPIIEMQKLPFGERAELSKMESLKIVTKETLMQLWDQWAFLSSEEYSKNDGFFTQELRARMNPFFATVRFSLEDEEVAGIDMNALEEIVQQLEDPISLELLDNPYRIGCGHRLSKENLDLNNDKCIITDCVTDKPSQEDPALDAFIKLIMSLKA